MITILFLQVQIDALQAQKNSVPVGSKVKGLREAIKKLQAADIIFKSHTKNWGDWFLSFVPGTSLFYQRVILASRIEHARLVLSDRANYIKTPTTVPVGNTKEIKRSKSDDEIYTKVHSNPFKKTRTLNLKRTSINTDVREENKHFLRLRA